MFSEGDETVCGASAVFTSHPFGEGLSLTVGEAGNGPNENPTWEAAGKLDRTYHR